jgi:PAS domain S-box-containing protein
MKDEKKTKKQLLGELEEMRRRIAELEETVIDSTERERAKEEPKSEKEFTEASLNAQTDTFFVFDPATGQALRWNAAFRKISGYSDEEIRSMKAPESFYSEEDLKKAAAATREILAGKKVTVEMSLITKNGRRIPTEYTGSVINDSKDNPTYIIAVGRDITERKKAEEALRESEERYRTLVDHSRTGIYVRQGDRFRFVNRRIVEITGYTEEELLEMPIMNLVHPEDRERALEEMAIYDSDKGARRIFECRIVTKNGDTRWLELFGAPVTYEGKHAVLNSFSDITDRKRAEEALKESYSLIQATLESTADGILVTDIKGNMLQYSGKFLEMWGIPETISKSDDDYDIRRLILKQLKCPEKALKEAEEAYQDPDKEGFAVIELKDGRIFETYWFPQKIEGKTVGAVTSWRDVTHRRKAEEDLRESEERYRTVVDSAMTGMYIRRRANFLFVNERAAKITGYTQEELLGMAPLDLVHPEDRDRAQRQMAEREASDRPHTFFQYRIKTKSGIARWIEQFGTPIVYEGERAILGQFIDFTERKEAEEERQKLEAQIQHAQKLESIGTLAGGIAHDFNNLLTSVLGNAELAVMHIPHFSPAINNLEEISTAARRAADLCSQMLAYSGRGQFIVRAIDLTSLVREMSQLLEVSISKKASLKYEFSEEIPAIEADPSQIHQIVMNLIINASEALGDDRGTIVVKTGSMQCDRAYLSDTYLGGELPPGEYAFAEISDTGCGMDDETREKMFDPFFSTKFTGRGLGLAAVLGIVRGHRGAISLRTEPGKGTTFRVLLPCSMYSVRAAIDQDASEAEEWQGSGTVMLVDDEASVLKIGTRMLEMLGFDVLTAVDGIDAVELFRRRKDEVELILLDITMPRMGGQEAFEKIKEIKGDAIIILSSGYEEQEVVNRFAGQGPAGFIHKPYQFETLKKMVRHALGD